MQLPSQLQSAVEQEIAACPLNELRKAAIRMTEHYHSGQPSPALFIQAASRLAYLAVRMPATYAVIWQVFQEIKESLPDWQPKSFLDIGAGPGTGGWAASEQFSLLQSICFVEPSQPMSDVGQRLQRASLSPVLQQAKWKTTAADGSADLALFSYLIGEMKPTQVVEMLEDLWPRASVFAVIEPGTPEGFRRILAIRKWAIERQANIIAPCPHTMACPMSGSNWCHFPARVERTRLHKMLKEGTLGYEDEKFSYLVFGKIPSSDMKARIVSSPHKASGFVKLNLCVDGQLKEIIVSKKQEKYRLARKADWGDPF